MLSVVCFQEVESVSFERVPTTGMGTSDEFCLHPIVFLSESIVLEFKK